MAVRSECFMDISGELQDDDDNDFEDDDEVDDDDGRSEEGSQMDTAWF